MVLVCIVFCMFNLIWEVGKGLFVFLILLSFLIDFLLSLGFIGLWGVLGVRVFLMWFV